jgi:hypothetical protein
VYREVGATALVRAAPCLGDPAKDVQRYLLGLEIERDDGRQADQAHRDPRPESGLFLRAAFGEADPGTFQRGNVGVRFDLARPHRPDTVPFPGAHDAIGKLLAAMKPGDGPRDGAPIVDLAAERRRRGER